MNAPVRPAESFSLGLQHERTALAWERTAIAMMVAGMALARFAAVNAYWVYAIVGLAQTAFGGLVLVWAGSHYDDLHGPLRRGDDVVHPLATRLVGLVAIGGSGLALTLALIIVLTG